MRKMRLIRKLNSIKMRNFFLEKATTRKWDEDLKLERNHLQKQT